jgi:predicted alpha/beta hydrolase
VVRTVFRFVCDYRHPCRSAKLGITDGQLMERVRTEDIATPAGHLIAAKFYQSGENQKAAVIIVPAMGVRQDYYASFARWLASKGYLVASFDFNGIGHSRRADLRRVKSDIIDWAENDCGAVLDALAARLRGKPLFWIGHSLGGQILPLVPGHERVTKAVTIATGSGYWLENSPSLRWRAWFLWYIVAPPATALAGYFPGETLHMVGDLPAGVMRQWRRWCLNPDYAVGVEGPAMRARYSAVRVPITSLSFTDDEYMSAKNTESLHGFYTNAPKIMKRIAPADIGVRRIGHFGFFREPFREMLWEGVLLAEIQGRSEGVNE